MTTKTILALAQTHRSEPSLANYSALADAVKAVVEERDRYQRMFQAACVALGEIGDALGCDPDEGGAEPILAAIKELKGEAEKSERRAQAIAAGRNHILAMQAALIDVALKEQTQ